MEGKLIKRGENDYKLFVNDTPFGQSKKSPYNKLSLKNCQAIERGYDLDELAKDFIRDVFGDKKIEIDLSNGIIISFIKGFQKALEILGDKKFSEQDMYKMFIYGRSIDTAKKHLKKIEDKPIDEFFNDFIQSLQQTEWDVEIVTKPFTEVSEGFELETKREPKLDVEGCLILRRL